MAPFLIDGYSRRWWLLQKALESSALHEALEVALAAELFVIEGWQETSYSRPYLINMHQINDRASRSIFTIEVKEKFRLALRGNRNGKYFH
jgi:hypothetical protein